MHIYVMLKPGFDTKENIEELKTKYLTNNNGFRILKEASIKYDKQSGSKHYDNLVGTNFFDETVDYISSAPAYGMIVEFEGDEKTWQLVRQQLMGATKDPQPGSVRYDFTIGRGQKYNIGTNVIHSSDSEENAEKEIKIFESLIKN